MQANKIFLFFLINLSVATISFAQDDFENAGKAFKEGKYTDALDFYKKSFLQNSSDRTKQAEITFKIAQTYHKLRLISEAELWYKRAIIVKYPDPIAVLYYAEMLRLNQKHEEAVAEYKKYSELVPSDTRGKKGIDLCLNAHKEESQTQENISLTKNNQANNNSTSLTANTVEEKQGYIFSDNSTDKRTFLQKKDSLEKLISRLDTTGNKKALARVYNNIAGLYYYNGDNNSAINYYNQSLKTKEDIGDKQGASASLVNLGIIYNNGYHYDEAIKCYQKSLKLKHEIDDKPGESKLLYRIANIYYNNNDFEKAAGYFTKTLELDKNLKNEKDIAISSNNLGVMLYELKNYDKSIEILEASLKLNKATGHDKEASIALNNLGNIQFDLKKYDEALNYYKQSLALKEKIDYKKGMAISLYNIGNVHRERNKSDKAHEYYGSCEKIAKENNFYDVLYSAYIAISDLYATDRNCEKAFDYFKMAEPLKRFAMNFRKNKPLSELQMKDDPDGLKNTEEISLLTEEITKQRLIVQEMNQRREMEMELQNAELSRKETEVNAQKTQKYASLAGLLLLLVIAFLLFRSFKIKKKQNEIIKIKNEELQQQKEEIIVQRDLVTTQKEHIETIHSELTDSIHYAERIQQAVMPNLELVAWNLEFETFILFKPKDIISGDFCFFEKRKNLILMAVADCTGHGVPGALMSMLGLSFLHEIIAKEHINSASQVLDELRAYIIHSLQQKGIYGEQKDGMDVAFVAFDSETKIIQYAGANNPLYLVSSDTKELTEIKPDKMPVAIYEKMNSFTNNVIQLKTSDTIYLASDGFEDQFGGPNRKKFLSKKFKQLLVENCSKSMVEQKEILNTTIENWKDNFGLKHEQTDDITIMGIKIS